MDVEQIKKRQTIKVIITETIMVLSVIGVLTVLMMIVSGYWINQDFQVERQGMVQVSSTPTGANIIIDGEEGWMQKTNGSKILSSGEHVISLSKEGYGDWSKTINIKEGLMYRLNYPRLFPLERTAEKMAEYNNVSISSVSPDRNSMLLINNTTDWTILKLNTDKIEEKKLDVSEVFPGASKFDGEKTGLLNDEILSLDWSGDNNKIIFRVLSYDEIKWLILDLKNPEKSINLTDSFDMKISSVKIFDSSADNLLIIEDGNLRKINIPSQSASKVLAENVVNFSVYDGEIIYSAYGAKGKYISALKNVDDDPVKLIDTDAEKAFAVRTKFYNDKYSVIVENQEVTLYKGDEKNMEIILKESLPFVPEKTKISSNGDYFIMRNGNHVAALDMESESVKYFDTDSDNIGWLDGYIIYNVVDGELVIYDYDGLNRRVLSDNVSSRFSATITEDKWLYYFSDGWLIRENLSI